MKRPRTGSIGARISLGLATALIAWLLHFGVLGRSLDAKGLDLLFILRGPHAIPDDAVIVAIDELSFAELGLQWPWPRTLHARLVDRLRTAGARVIAFDVIFAEPSKPDEDAALAGAVERAGNVVLASDLRIVETPTIRQTIRVMPLPILARVAARLGNVNLVQEQDGVIRRAKLAIHDVPAFAGAVVSLAGWPGPVTDTAFLINYVGPWPAFRTVSYAAALDAMATPDAMFRDKVVFVGRAVGPAGRPVDDAHYTPYFWWNRRLTPGVEIHASIVDTVLRHREIGRVNDGLRFAWAAGWGVLAALSIGRASPATGVFIALLLGTAQAGVALAVLSFANVWVPWVTSGLATGVVYGATLMIRWRSAEREKAFVRDAFQHYVHPTVVEAILERPDRLRLGGERVEATVLFSDLEGFTTLAEGLTPEELIAFLNRYLSAMSDVILEHRGMLNQTTGDGILAVWSVPIRNADHAIDACRAALAMQERLVTSSAELSLAGRRPLRMRIGIHTGHVVVGNVGSPQQFRYGLVGDAVNLAARLEGINKLYGTGLVVSEDTAQQLRDAFVLRELDLIRVVGRVQPARIYECLGPRDTRRTERHRGLAVFAAGLDAYRRRDWDTALDLMERACVAMPGDGPSLEYVTRIRRYLLESPPEDWDGVYAAQTKQG